MTNANARWSWKNEPELMDRLREAQNRPANMNQDIMTIVGFFTCRAELERHVIVAELRVVTHSTPRTRQVIPVNFS